MQRKKSVRQTWIGVGPLKVADFYGLLQPQFHCIFGSLSCAKLVFPSGSDGDESTCNAGEPGLIPGSGRSLWEGNGNPLQYSCLENLMDRGAWRGVHGAANSWTQLQQLSTHASMCQTQSPDSVRSCSWTTAGARWVSAWMREWRPGTTVMILFLAAHPSCLKLASDTWWQVFRQPGQRGILSTCGPVMTEVGRT